MNTLMNQLAPHLLRIGRAIHRRSLGYSNQGFEGEPCPACGANEGLSMHGALWPELTLQWKLTPAWANWVDQRESLRCSCCQSNLRSRQLAHIIVNKMNVRLGICTPDLARLCEAPEMQTLAVAEINAAGDLHPFLQQLQGLRYSEYGSTLPEVRSEDLQSLSYTNESFDLVVNSDVLEHVPDVERALAEIHRVLKPDGIHIFSVPVIWNQARSIRRAEIRDGQLVHILPPSYHGTVQEGKNDFLVFHEFGQDFVHICERIGFSVELVYDPRNPALVSFVACRLG